MPEGAELGNVDPVVQSVEPETAPPGLLWSAIALSFLSAVLLVGALAVGLLLGLGLLSASSTLEFERSGRLLSGTSLGRGSLLWMGAAGLAASSVEAARQAPHAPLGHALLGYLFAILFGSFAFGSWGYTREEKIAYLFGLAVVGSVSWLASKRSRGVDPG